MDDLEKKIKKAEKIGSTINSARLGHRFAPSSP